MRTIRFASRGAAEAFLECRGFEFRGAPNRWRKLVGHSVIRAEVCMVATIAVVRLVRGHPGQRKVA